jgi:hypothetical protein
MFPLTVSPNICLFIDPVDGEISCQSVTDQILLGEVSYNGNSFPSRARTLDRILASARVLAEWFRGRGLTGYVGFDFCEYETPGGAAGFFLAEINPRVNGAIYATALMNKMNSGMTQAFMTKFARPPSRSFSELCDLLRGRLFDPRTGTGIVPYNTGCLPYGRCILAVFGQSLDQVRTLASEALP